MHNFILNTVQLYKFSLVLTTLCVHIEAYKVKCSLVLTTLCVHIEAYKVKLVRS